MNYLHACSRPTKFLRRRLPRTGDLNSDRGQLGSDVLVDPFWHRHNPGHLTPDPGSQDRLALVRD